MPTWGRKQIGVFPLDSDYSFVLVIHKARVQNDLFGFTHPKIRKDRKQF